MITWDRVRMMLGTWQALNEWRFIFMEKKLFKELRKAFIIVSVFFFNLHCNTDALQCFSFYCMAKWISYTYTYNFLFCCFPSHLDHHRALSRVPCAIYSRFSLVTYFTYFNSITRVYVSMSISQLIPPPVSPLVSGIVLLFSTSVSLFLLCK